MENLTKKACVFKTSNNGVNTTCIDMSIKNPRSISIANCVSARTDRGISNRYAEGSGICEQYTI